MVIVQRQNCVMVNGTILEHRRLNRVIDSILFKFPSVRCERYGIVWLTIWLRGPEILMPSVYHEALQEMFK